MTSFWEDRGGFTEDIANHTNKKKFDILLKSSSELSESERGGGQRSKDGNEGIRA